MRHMNFSSIDGQLDAIHEFYVIHYIYCVVRLPDVFIVTLKTDINSGIQILAPWRMSHEGIGK